MKYRDSITNAARDIFVPTREELSTLKNISLATSKTVAIKAGNAVAEAEEYVKYWSALAKISRSGFVISVLSNNSDLMTSIDAPEIEIIKAKLSLAIITCFSLSSLWSGKILGYKEKKLEMKKTQMER